MHALSNRQPSCKRVVLSSIDVADTLGLVDHRVSWGSFGSCPFGRCLEDKPCQVVAEHTGLEDAPQLPGSRWVGERVELHFVGSLARALGGRLLADHLLG